MKKVLMFCLMLLCSMAVSMAQGLPKKSDSLSFFKRTLAHIFKKDTTKKSSVPETGQFKRFSSKETIYLTQEEFNDRFQVALMDNPAFGSYVFHNFEFFFAPKGGVVLTHKYK